VIDLATLSDRLDGKQPEHGGVHGYALIVSFFDQAHIVLWDGDPGITEWMVDAGSNGSNFPISTDDAFGRGFKKPDGVYLAELGWKNMGPSDCDDRRPEYSACIKTVRPATQEEWQDHLHGQWPWDHEPFMIEEEAD